jgi:PAS domain S-box-containing protein
MGSTTAELFENPTLSSLCDKMFSQGNMLAAVLLPDLRCAYLSPNHQRLTGWNHTDLQSHWLAHIHPDDRSELIKLLRNCLFQPGQHFSYDYRMHHGDGRWRWYRARCP